MDLNNFSQGKSNKEYENYNNYINKDANSAVENEVKHKAEDIVNKYKNYSESDLTSEILKSIKDQKANGQFNKQAIMDSINSLSGLIPADAKDKIFNILNSVDYE